MFLGQGSDTLAPLYKISFKKKYTQWISEINNSYFYDMEVEAQNTKEI